MNRPTELHLLPDEMYPTERNISNDITETPSIINNMTQMADFVYKLYMKKVEALKMAMESMKTLYDKLPTENEQEKEENRPIRSDKKVKESFVVTTIQNEIDLTETEMEKREISNVEIGENIFPAEDSNSKENTTKTVESSEDVEMESEDTEKPHEKADEENSIEKSVSENVTKIPKVSEISDDVEMTSETKTDNSKEDEH